MKNLFYKIFLTLIVSISVLSLSCCSSDENLVDTKTTENVNKIQVSFDADVESVSTRVLTTDGLDDTPPTFSSTWEEGDQLVAYDVNTKAQCILTASSSGKSVRFTGYMEPIKGADGLEGPAMHDKDQIALVSTNCSIDATNGTATLTMSNQKGTIKSIESKALLYGSTTAVVSGSSASLKSCTIQQKMAIIRLQCLFADKNAATLAAFSMTDESSATSLPFASSATCNLSKGTITYDNASTHHNYLRATFDELQQPTEKIYDGKTYYLTNIYMVMAPTTLPSELTMNAYSLGNITYKEKINLTNAVTLTSGDVQPVRINYLVGAKTEPAISCPGFDFSLSPGQVIAYRDNETAPWQYKFASEQGGVIDIKTETFNSYDITNQCKTFGCYFTWGSVDPMDVLYTYKDNTGKNQEHSAVGYDTKTFQDVASKCGDGKWRMPTKGEAELILAALVAGKQYEGYFQDGRMVYGRYVGTNTQPTKENQDHYFFFPYVGDLHYKDKKTEKAFTYNEITVYYGTPAAYLDNNKDYHQISLWTSAYGTELDDNKTVTGGYRLQYNPANSKISSSVKPREVGYGRIIRGVRY